MSVLKTATCCWRQAAEAEIQAAQITDPHLKTVYLRIAHQWSVLARSYEFADSAEHFLLDAKRNVAIPTSKRGPGHRVGAGVQWQKTLSCQSLRKFNFHTFATIWLPLYRG